MGYAAGPTVGERQGPGTGDRNRKEKGKSKKEKVGKGVGDASTHLKKSPVQPWGSVFP